MVASAAEPRDLTALLGWEALENQDAGTLVHWGDLDQLAVTEGGDRQTWKRCFSSTRSRELGISSVPGRRSWNVPRVNMRMNGRDIPAADPFLKSHNATQTSPAESIDINGQVVQVKTFTLPFVSKLSNSDRAKVMAVGALKTRRASTSTEHTGWSSGARGSG